MQRAVIPLMILTVIAAIRMMNTSDVKTTAPVVRPATQAGRFYEGNPQVLSHEVDSFLALHAHDGVQGNVAALIVPHAGYYYSGSVAASAYMALDTARH